MPEQVTFARSRSVLAGDGGGGDLHWNENPRLAADPSVLAISATVTSSSLYLARASLASCQGRSQPPPTITIGLRPNRNAR